MDSKGDIELNQLEGAEKLRYQIWYGDWLNFRYPFYTNIICQSNFKKYIKDCLVEKKTERLDVHNSARRITGHS